MRIYLDDSLAFQALAQLLTSAGHDVQLSADVGLRGADHAEHLTKAIREGRVCFSRHDAAYQKLHNLIGAAQGQHAGVLIVHRYHDPARDLTYRGMVRALRHLESAGFPMASNRSAQPLALGERTFPCKNPSCNRSARRRWCGCGA